MSPLDAPLQRLYDIVEYLVDERLGIIRHVVEIKRESGAPNLFTFYAKACDTAAFRKSRNFSDGGGASIDRGHAMAKAVGEAVERYCASFYEPDDLLLSPFKCLPVKAISPDMFALFSEQQYLTTHFPYHPFNRDTPVRWTPAVEVTSGEQCYVPAAMVFVPYHADGHGEAPIVQSISTGLACHSTFEAAAISAVCEVIERDAFTIVWQSKMSPPHIMLNTLSCANTDLVCRFRDSGASVELLNITLDHGIPTVLAVLRHTAPELPALVFAAAAHLDWETAIRKSLEELALTLRLGKSLKAHTPRIQMDSNFTKVVDKSCHVRLYCDHGQSHFADFLFESSRTVDCNELASLAMGSFQEDMTTLIDIMRKRLQPVVLADVTTSDIRELGLVVVRAVLPGFHPLCFGHRLRALGGLRLWTVPQQLGYPGITQETGDNCFPHPYP
ncbi:MAG: hypothetical protein CV090_06235 [Nitrospira sp. WS238]|nr:hypothetical protein [Nitrospira sp. WS238]